MCIRDSFKDKIKGKFVKNNSMHLTLKFIGEKKPEEICRIKDILKDVSLKFSPFKMKIDYAGAFPKKKPRVLWFGSTCEEFVLLAKEISKELYRKAKIPEEKREVIPHLTICRLKEPFVPEEFFKLKFEYEFEVEKFYLIQSILKPEGAQYIDLAEFSKCQ